MRPQLALLAALAAVVPTVQPATAAPPTEAPGEQRIVPVNGDLAEIVWALGLGDRVVATDTSATYPAEAAESPKIGYQRNLVAETILSFEPTIVLAGDNAGPPEVLDQLRDAGVEVAVIESDNTLDEPAAKIRAVADALGVDGEPLAEQVESEIEAAIADVGDGQPRVAGFYLRGDELQLLFGEGSGLDALIEAAGGVDVGTELGVVESAPMSAEAIIDAAPDIIITTAEGLASVGGIDGLLEVDGIARTPAGERRQVHAFDAQYLLGLGPRTGEVLAELVAIFHGDETVVGNTEVGGTDVGDTGAGDTGADDTDVGETDVDEEDPAEVFRTVFDSTVAAADKIHLVEDGEDLLDVLEGYETAAAAVGGIAVEPTAVTVDADTAAISYDLLFGEAVFHEGLDSSTVLVDGAWIVPRDEFCAFMSQARNPCPAA